jgi:hypothetical protein
VAVSSWRAADGYLESETALSMKFIARNETRAWVPEAD